MQNTIIWVNGDTIERITNIDGTVVCTERVRISDKERCKAVMSKFWEQLLKEQKHAVLDTERQ